VKQVAPLVRGMTAAVPRSGGYDSAMERAVEMTDDGHHLAPVTTTTETSTSAEDELPEPGTTRHLLAKFQSFQTTTHE